MIQGEYGSDRCGAQNVERLVTLVHKLFEDSWALQHKSDENFVVATLGSGRPRRVILLSWDWLSSLHHHGMTRVIDWTFRVQYFRDRPSDDCFA